MADSDGSVVVNIDMDVKDAEKELQRLKTKLISLGDALDEKKAKRTYLEKEFEDAYKKLDELQKNAPKNKYGGLANPDDKKLFDELISKTNALHAEWEKVNKEIGIDEAVYNATLQKYGDLRKSTVGIAAKTKEAWEKAGNAIGKSFSHASENLSEFFSGVSKKFADGVKKVLGFNSAAKATGAAMSRLGNMIKNAFVFNVISQGLGYIREQVSDYLQTNTQLMSALSQLKGALASAFAPIFSAIVPALTTLISWVTSAITAVAQFIAALFGKTIKFTQATTAATKAGTSASGKNAAAMEEQADAMEDVGEAADDATKSLAAFDEINTLATDNAKEAAKAPSAGGSGGGGGGGGAWTPTGVEFETIDNPFEDWGQAFSDFLDKILNEGIPRLREGFEKFAAWFNELNKKLYDMFTFPGVEEKVILIGQRLAEAFNYLVDLIDWELFGRALGAGLNLALQFLVSFIYSFDWIALGGALSQFINGLVDEIGWYEFGQLLWARFKIALETLAGFLLGLDMPGLAEAASNIALGFFNSITETFSTIDWNGIGTQIATFLNEVKWDEVGTAAFEAIKTALSSIGDAFVGFLQEAEPEILLALGLLIFAIAMGLPQLIMSNLSLIALIAVLALKWEEIMGAITDFIQNTDWAGLIENAISFILGFVTSADWAGFAESTFEAIGAAFGAAVNTLWQLIQDAWNNIVDWWHEDAFGDGGFITDGLLDGIIEKAGDLGAWAREHIVDPFLNGIKGAFGIASPSTVMQENGVYLIDGLYNGLQNEWAIVTQFLDFMRQGFDMAWTQIMESTIQIFTMIGENLGMIWTAIVENLNIIVEGLKQNLSDAWTSIHETVQTIFKAVSDFIVKIWETISRNVSETVNNMKRTLADAWDNIKNTAQTGLDAVKDVFQSVWDGIVGIVQSAADTIKSIVDGIGAAISGVINAARNAASSIGSALSNVVGGRSIALDTGVPVFPVPDFQIPALAAGAVIPPNRSFLAMLGDQPSGTNVEAPLSTIEEALQNVLNRNGNGDINITFTGDLAQLARVLRPVIEREGKRIKGSLIEEAIA